MGKRNRVCSSEVYLLSIVSREGPWSHPANRPRCWRSPFRCVLWSEADPNLPSDRVNRSTERKRWPVRLDWDKTRPSWWSIATSTSTWGWTTMGWTLDASSWNPTRWGPMKLPSKAKSTPEDRKVGIIFIISPVQTIWTTTRLLFFCSRA